MKLGREYTAERTLGGTAQAVFIQVHLWGLMRSVGSLRQQTKANASWLRLHENDLSGGYL